MSFVTFHVEQKIFLVIKGVIEIFSGGVEVVKKIFLVWISLSGG